MKKSLKHILLNNKGITLTSLVITIIILLIIAAIAVPEASKAIKNAKTTSYVSEMQLMQEKANNLNQDLKNGNNTVLTIGVPLQGEAYSALKENTKKDIATAFEYSINKTVEDAADAGYRYYSKSVLESIDLKDFSQEFLVNVKTKDVVSMQGVLYQGAKYYMLSQLPNGLYHVEYNGVTSRTDFDLYYIDADEELTLEVIDIQYSGNIKRGTIYYGQGESEDNIDWKIAANNTTNTSYEIKINEEGTWYVKVEDAAGNTAIDRIEVERGV